MKKNNAYLMWDDLEDISKQNDAKDFYKNVFSNNNLDIFFQSNFRNELQIFIHFNEFNDSINMNLNGIEVITDIKSDLDKAKEIIIIKNKNIDNNNLFKAFSATLFENLEESKNSHQSFDQIVKTIDDYRNYFNGQYRKKLSALEQQGLFGEFSYILEELNKHNYSIVSNWEGSDKNKHDFVFENHSLEVKTTKNQTRLNIHISNENQLDNDMVDKLLLKVYRLEKVEVGLSIRDLYLKILNNLDYKKSNQFKAKVLKLGINLDIDDQFIGFNIINEYLYNVDEKFPKISSKALDDRIFEVKYYINLDGIEVLPNE